MRTMAFSLRNTKETLRDLLTLFFGVGLPLVLIALLSAINSSLGDEAQYAVPLFQIDKLAPAISVFSLSFVALFGAMLISKDRSTSFMSRLLTSPLKPWEFIVGYALPLIPISVLQSLICYVAGFLFGLEINANVLLGTVVNIPIAVVFISLGLLFGTLLNEKAVGGVCGTLLTNLSAWFSNIWFDTELVGGWFKSLADILPFSHGVNAARFAVEGSYSQILPELYWVFGYGIVITAAAVIVFNIKMKRDK